HRVEKQPNHLLPVFFLHSPIHHHSRYHLLLSAQHALHFHMHRHQHTLDWHLQLFRDSLQPFKHFPSHHPLQPSPSSFSFLSLHLRLSRLSPDRQILHSLRPVPPALFIAQRLPLLLHILPIAALQLHHFTALFSFHLPPVPLKQLLPQARITPPVHDGVMQADRQLKPLPSQPLHQHPQQRRLF